jgi:hypothetical protein
MGCKISKVGAHIVLNIPLITLVWYTVLEYSSAKHSELHYKAHSFVCDYAYNIITF